MAWDDYDYGGDVWGRGKASQWNFLNPQQAQPAGQFGQTGQADWSNRFGDFGTGATTGLGASIQSALPQDVAMRRRQAPEYDYAPMQRYAEYMKSEPNQEDYKPGKLNRVLNSALAGIEGYTSRDVGRGLKLGEYLNERPYQQAQNEWQKKGSRYEADVKIADARHRNAEAAYSRSVDDRRADETLQLARQKIQLDIDAAKDRGWTFEDGPDGKQVARRIRGGQVEVLPTVIPNGDFTVDEKRDNRREDVERDIHQFDTPSGGAKLSAETSRANARLAAETAKGSASYKGTDAAINPNLPGDTSTPQKLFLAFPEFNDPKMYSVSGTRMLVADRYKNMTPTQQEDFLKAKAARLGMPYEGLISRLKDFRTRSRAMMLPEDE